MFTYGTIQHPNNDNKINWKIGKENYPTEKSFLWSSQFKLPNYKDISCRLFLDLDKKEIGIENVSSGKGSVVLTGSVCICYYSTGTNTKQNRVGLEKLEITDRICIPVCFPPADKIYQVCLEVSSAHLCPEKKTSTATLSTDFAKVKLLSCGEYSDIKILCKDDKVVKCHKIILASRSDVFKKMLDNDFKEGNSGIIKLDYMDLHIIQDLLSYIYSGTIKNPENAMELLEAADQFQVEDLKEMCGDLLLSKLTVANVLESLAIADRYRLVELKKSAIALTVKNANAVFKSTKFTEFCTKFADKQFVIDIVKTQNQK